MNNLSIELPFASTRTLDLTSAGQKFLEITAKEDQISPVLKSKLFYQCSLRGITHYPYGLESCNW